MDAPLKKAALEGLADALGFVLGGIAGWQLGLLFGFDFLGSTQWAAPQIIGLVLILVGCGLGRWLFRRLAAKLG